MISSAQMQPKQVEKLERADSEINLNMIGIARSNLILLLQTCACAVTVVDFQTE